MCLVFVSEVCVYKYHKDASNVRACGSGGVPNMHRTRDLVFVGAFDSQTRVGKWMLEWVFWSLSLCVYRESMPVARTMKTREPVPQLYSYTTGGGGGKGMKMNSVLDDTCVPLSPCTGTA